MMIQKSQTEFLNRNVLISKKVKRIFIKIIFTIFMAIILTTNSIFAEEGTSESNYKWVTSYSDAVTTDGQIKLNFNLKLVNRTGTTTSSITVTEGTNDFYIDDVHVDNYKWSYSGFGGTEESPELIYQRPIVSNYTYSAPPTINIKSVENNNTKYKVVFSFSAATKTVQLKNVITTNPASAIASNPWTWSPTLKFYDRVIGYSCVLDTNPENYTYPEMKKTLNQWTGGSITCNVSSTDAGKYQHITFYTYGGNTSSYVYKIPSANTLSYNTCGGTNISSNVPVFVGGVTNVKSDVPTRTGYIFGGWYDNEKYEGSVYTANQEITINANKTLYAKWTPITYTIKYDGNNATSGTTADSNHTYDIEKNLTVNGYERKYTVTYNHNYPESSDISKIATYTFNGWSKSSNGNKEYNNSQSIKNLTTTNNGVVNLYANWNQANVNYIPTRLGYIFDGWYTTSNLTGNRVDLNGTYTPDSNVTLYAKWLIDESQTKEVSYTVEYYKDGEKQDADTQTVKTNIQVLQPNKIPVNKAEINTTNKYKKYKLEKTEPNTIPDAIDSGSIIKVYYIKDIDLEETISIELTKKWVDNKIQALRRPDSIKFIVMPIVEENEEGIVTTEEIISNENVNNEVENIQGENGLSQGKNTVDMKTEDTEFVEENSIGTKEEKQNEQNDETKKELADDKTKEEQNDKELINAIEKQLDDKEQVDNISKEENLNYEVNKVQTDNKSNVKVESEPKTLADIINQREEKSNEINKIDNIMEDKIKLEDSNKEMNTAKTLDSGEVIDEDTKVALENQDNNIQKPEETVTVQNNITIPEGEKLEYYVFEFIELVDKEENTTIYTLQGLPRYDKTTEKEIKYIIKEEEVNEGDLKFYNSTDGEVKSATDGEESIKYTAEIVNTFKLPENNVRNISGIKAWNDNNNKKLLRPESIVLQLIGRVKNISLLEQENQELSYVEDNISMVEENIESTTYEDIISKEQNVSNTNSWKHVFTDLPIYDDNGQEIEYTLQEKLEQEELKKYITETNEINEANEITVTNNLIVQDSIIQDVGTEEINALDSKVTYNIDYIVELDNRYIENATIELVDTLPYQIDEEKSDLKGGIYNYNEETNIPTVTWTGIYNPVTKLIEWQNSIENDELEQAISIEVTEDNERNVQVINTNIQINVTYKDIPVVTEKITNNVVGKITLSNNVVDIVEASCETRTRWIRNITVNNIWKGGTDKTIPDSIELELLASIKDENGVDIEYILPENIETSKTLSKDANWTETLWTDLPSYTTEGQQIYYNLEQIQVEGYKFKVLQIDENESNIEITLEGTKLYKLPITGGIGVDTVRNAELLIMIVLLILITNRKKIVPERRGKIQVIKNRKLVRRSK